MIRVTHRDKSYQQADLHCVGAVRNWMRDHSPKFYHFQIRRNGHMMALIVPDSRVDAEDLLVRTLEGKAEPWLKLRTKRAVVL